MDNKEARSYFWGVHKWVLKSIWQLSRYITSDYDTVLVRMGADSHVKQIFGTLLTSSFKPLFHSAILYKQKARKTEQLPKLSWLSSWQTDAWLTINIGVHTYLLCLFACSMFCMSCLSNHYNIKTISLCLLRVNKGKNYAMIFT